MDRQQDSAIVKAQITGATPLLALEAVVMDTETTGLDPERARLIEFAAIPLINGAVDDEAAISFRVRPDLPIPPETTAIHGISDRDVADAQPFSHKAAEVIALLEGKVVVGHATGFDFAVLRNECVRAGRGFTPPLMLDTRLLAQVAAPQLAGYSLDKLASWLGVEVKDRHSALGDVKTTARVFLALLPKLREKNIRTLAEAEAACRALSDVMEKDHAAGWLEGVRASALGAEKPLAGIDSFAYRHRSAEVMSAPPFVLSPNATLEEALKAMNEKRFSSVFVADVGEGERQGEPLWPHTTGILTERDVMRTLAKFGPSAFALKIGDLSNKPLLTVQADAFIYRAVGRMARANVRHLGVINERGEVVGALSARDLLRLRAQGAVNLGDEIDHSVHAADLARAWGQLAEVTLGMRKEDIPPLLIAGVISRELGALTRQAAVIGEARMERDGFGKAPMPYCVAVLGSAGRGESLLAMDQDNALIFERGEEGGEADLWFAKLGKHIADILNEAGVPYCKGGVMASEPLWRGSLETWQGRISDWLRRSSPQDLLNVDIFFDMRPVHGALDYARQLRAMAFAGAERNRAFAMHLSQSIKELPSPFTIFGQVRLDDGRIDLKRNGLFHIVSVARIIAITRHIAARGTPERLRLFAEEGGNRADMEALINAHEVFVGRILDQQLADLAKGQPPSNRVAYKSLTDAARSELKTALEAVSHVEDVLVTALGEGE